MTEPHVPTNEAALREQDAKSRRDALDPGRSFVVQAPAGSGKTELLIQRTLVLLAAAGQPEEVVAITFTRKAAAEMRQRILRALAAAAGPPPEKPHLRLTWELARDVARRDAELQWHLAENPGRLRTLTIDALCREITLRQPLLARLGGAPGVTEDALPLYREAARGALAALERGPEGPAAEAVRRLLLHLDDDTGQAEALLIRMLARRDQWLRHLPQAENGSAAESAGPPPREALEAALRETVAEALAALQEHFFGEARRELAALLEYAAANRADRDAALAGWEGISREPGPADADGLAAAHAGWQAVATLLLTTGNHWRKRVDARDGFPTPATANGAEKARRTRMKARAMALLNALDGEEPAREALAAARTLPYVRYPERQWEVLEALLRLLPVALERLRAVFAERGTLDFTEVAAAATRVLERRGGHDDADAIRHLLIDEFQDTSHTQYRLVEALIAGWSEGDGRTLFLVGDPMQSIYGFREADVGLFLRARREGIGALKPAALRLAVNFRATQTLVAWANGAFPDLLPATESIEKAAVPFTPASAAPQASAGPAVAVHPFLERDDAAEAARMVALVREARERMAPGESVAILVRARPHLGAVLPALRAAGIPYRAVEIDALAERPAVQDLLALARALLHPADRIAWLAVLRAPWCGLALDDLLRLMEGAGDATVWQRLAEHSGTLSADGRARLARLRPVLARALETHGRHPLRRWIEETWIALGGPACLDAGGLADAEALLALLAEEEGAAEPVDTARLLEAAGTLRAPPDPSAGNRVQVMTLHAAKGLEFDTVILPGLGRPHRGDDPELLLWSERPGAAGGLLLAPLGERGERDACQDYLRALFQEKARNETGRLLYVAATRAKRALHLLGHASLDAKSGEARPRAGTFLDRLWPGVEREFRALADAAGASPETETGAEAAAPAPAAPPRSVQRLVAGWRLPGPPARVTAPGVGGPGGPEPVTGAEELAPPPLEYLWAGTAARHVGTVVHRALQRMALLGAAAQTAEWIARRRAHHRAELARLGVPAARLEELLARVEAALNQTLGDPRGRWVLAPHAAAECELALTGWDEGRAVEVILDRTFMDEAGTRWIVDYKTGGHEGAGSEEFLDIEQGRYRPQLERYARILARLRGEAPGAIRLGLYFPLLQGWREWAAGKRE